MVDLDRLVALRDEYKSNPDKFKGSEKVLTCRTGCGSILTIADAGTRCRQCVLQGRN